MEIQAWHTLAPEEVARVWESPSSGLSEEEAQSRLLRYGANRLPGRKQTNWLKRFALQFHNPLIYVLLGASVLSGLLNHWVDTGVILAVVLVNAMIGVIHEGKAENSLEAIRRMNDPQATVRRNNRRQRIPAEELVVGDRLYIEAGDRVAADIRLVETHQLRIVEAILTGESLPVSKDALSAPAEAALGERSGMAFSGTLVAAGTGIGIVVATAEKTEMGTISRLLREVVELQTPLTRQMEQFARRVTGFILLFSVLIFTFAVFVRHYQWDEAFMIVVGLAVAAIPEGLPAVVTITLAVGVQRMAARHAIVRNLPSVETLGSVSIICSDKTGTLTRNEMMVQAVATHEAFFTLQGQGYEPSGRILRDGETVTEDPTLSALARAALLCNDADVAREPEGWKAHGDPMEAALVTFARKAGLDPVRVREAHPRTGEIPFNGELQYMLTCHTSDSTMHEMMVKGAPERVFRMVHNVLCNGGYAQFEPSDWLARTHTLASRGLRVLAFATARRPPVRGQEGILDVDDFAQEAPRGFTLLGLVGLIDPPRDTARQAIAECTQAGIRVKMITGDHAVTAAAVARQLGISESPVVALGEDLDGLSLEELAFKSLTTDVFARTTPEHKLRLVKALQADGSVVAMTGDGVNDAPALKRADVGVAMGLAGTEVAKEASQIILTDDNFASIVSAVREGRTVYDNIKKVIAWTLPTNGGETFAILGALTLGLALPVTPVQILWINLITAVALGLTLAFDPGASDVMTRPPRPNHSSLLDRRLFGQTLLLCGLFTIGVFSVYFGVLQRGGSLELARTLVVHTLVWMEIGYLLSVRLTPLDPLQWRVAAATPAVRIGIGLVLMCQVAFIYTPPLQRIFGTLPLTGWHWGVAIGCGAMVFAVVEAEKRLRPPRASGGIKPLL